MEVQILLDGVDYSADALFERTRVEQASDGTVSTASVTIKVLNAVGSLYGAAIYGLSPYGATSAPDFALAELIIQEKDASPANILFAGEVVRASKQTQAIQFDLWTLEAIGYESILDQSVVTATYSNQTDRAIIQAAFAAQAPSIAVASSTIDLIESNLYVDAEAWTLRELLDRLVTVSGGRWWLTPTKTLYYALSTSTTPPAAPFNIDVEYPDDSTTFSSQLTVGTLDYSKIRNHITVQGGYASGGTRASHTAQDATSQSAYGVRKKVLVEEALTTSALCQARAEAELLSLKDPQAYGSFVTRRDGLACGQKINIEARALGVSGDFLIKRLSMAWENRYDTVYTVEYGVYDARLDSLLRQIERQTINSRDRKGTILALPPADSVDAVHIKNLAVTTAKIDNLAVTEAKINSLAVTEAKIGALAVTEAKIGSLAVTTGKIANLAVTNAKINDLSVSKLTVGDAVFNGNASFGYGASQNKLTISSLAIKIEYDANNYIQATSGGVIMYRSGVSVQISSSGIVLTNGDSVGTLSSSSLKFTRSTANTEVSATGVQIWGGSSGIGIGASSFASSPVRITASGVEMGTSNPGVEITTTFVTLSYGSSTTFTIDSSGIGVLGDMTFTGGDLELTGLFGGGNVIVASGNGYYVGSNKIIGARGAAVADATGAGDVVAQLNALLARCRAHGLIAT